MGDGLPAWLIQLGEMTVGIGGVIAFLLRREEALRKDSSGFHAAAMQAVADGHKAAHTAIEAAKREAADALMAHATRTDSRHEALRNELNTHVVGLSQRIDRIGDDMVRREDFVALMARIEALAARVDRVLELKAKQ